MSDLVIDACCLINLVAAGNVVSKPPRKGKKKQVWFPATLHVPTEVENEALYILQPDADDATQLVKSAIDFSTLKQNEVIRGCCVEGEEESALFVRLAVRLDDGEAACLAIAKNRSWTLATDDRVAAKLADELKVTVVNTAQMVKMWADHSSASRRTIAETISNIQTYAKFVPRRQSAECDWWSDHATDS